MGTTTQISAADNLTAKTFHGVKWSYLSTSVGMLVQLVFTAVMARLLGPVPFGLVAMANVLLRFGSYFSQMGIGAALIQKGRAETSDLRAAFTLAVLLGSVFTAIFYLLAPMTALVFDNLEVVSIVRALSFSFFLNSLSLTSTSVLRIQLRFKTLALLEMTSFTVGYAGVGLTMAYLGYGVWSLVVCSLVQSAMIGILSYSAVRHSLLLQFDWGRARGFLKYGGQLSAVTLTQVLYLGIAPWSIGRYIGSSSLGYFNNASRLSSLALETFTAALSRVLFPSFSKFQADRERLRRSFTSCYVLLAVMITPVAYGMIPAADEIVTTILGPNWMPTVVLLQILCLAAPFSLLMIVIGSVFDATAHLRVKLVIESASIIVLLAACVSFMSLGVRALVSLYAVVEFARFATYLTALRPIIGLRMSEMHRAHRIVLVNSVLVAVSIAFARWMLVLLQVPVAGILLGEIAAGGSAFLLVTFVWGHDLVKSELRDIYEKVFAQVEARSTMQRMANWYGRRYLVPGYDSK